ncbi:CD225/dispanin family protein [Croceivirga thetidis]|uniref:CD225/dispanin family protein n=1 Tax=Croceivirga thetidis TaxID=2721623 RepID=A0ABX1GSG2_9FLAO|nr:CD225/dispanin family protein [Croceivirga thetidis]NKI32866.1 CD225/dispanin family protein [Croceivirga thetidis]
MDNSINQPPKPDNYLVWAILSTVLCCIVTGIPSIIYASKVNEAYERGEYEIAQENSRKAKNWAIAGPIIGIVVWLLYILVFGGLAFMGALNG